MTLDEDAAKVVELIRDEMTSKAATLLASKNPQLLGEKWYEQTMRDHIAAFGRRCAEAMREECAKESERLGSIGTPMITKTGRVYQDACRDVAQAVRRVEVKNIRARAKAPGD